jgi:hypothetical protein
VDDHRQKKHDRMEVTSARLLPDGKSVFLEISGMRLCDQIEIKYAINAKDGGAMSQEIYGTIYKLLPE